MGIFILVIIILAFIVGAVRQEFVLVLAGAVFLTVWIYCLVMTLLLAVIHNRRSRRAFIRISPREVAAGDQVEALYSEGEDTAFKGVMVQLPGILIRCRLLLATKDGRRIKYDFNPAQNWLSKTAPHFFTAEKRGAYFSANDEFAIFDILGFFRFAFRLSAENGHRLLVSPRAADEPLVLSARAGESNLPPEFSFQRTDNLIDHRPYIPGDDPRRINWKLYGHGGGLFVRDGEREPPAQSNIVILIDTEYDPLLYSPPAARRGIDVLCENALAAALACAESGMNVLAGFSGGLMQGGNTAAVLATALAWPAAMPLPAAAGLPAVPDEYGIIVFALPRSTAETSVIDRFLKHKSRTVELLFFCDNDEQLNAAEVCTALYNQRSGVKAGIFV
ncbi:MAG: DUF58 domain-containing protein [Treponema sp.]|nr:DUF58 domain-containing protein [Treponema sp.]